MPLGECQIENRLLLLNNIIDIPNSPKVYLRILKTYYAHPTTRYPSHAIMYELVSQDSW